MQTFKEGNYVAVLHETLKGRIVKIHPNHITFEDEDGFLWKYPQRRLVPLPSHDDYKITNEIPIKDKVVSTRIIPALVKTSPKKTPDRFEIDLHIEELREFHTHLSNFEIVQIQMTACRSFIMESLAANRKKVILIHGKGEGVLKSEIRYYLERLANERGIRLDYHDASYQNYGVGGATEVVLHG